MKARSLVLFDIDGTLLRGAPPHHREALIEGLRKATGREATFSGIDTSGQLDRDLIARLLGEVPASLDEITDHCQQAYLANCNTDLTPFVCSGVREVLAALQTGGAALGLVTGNLSKIGWRKMELAGLAGFFSVGAFSEDGLTRAELAQVAARRACVALADSRISLVGDHRNDIQAAKANGFQAVAVASGTTSFGELRLLEPDILVESLADLDVSRLL